MDPVLEADRRDVNWDLSQGRKNYASLVSAQVVSAALSFATVWLATRLLGSTGYGAVVAIVAASQAISQLAVNWTAVSLSRYGVQEFVETGHIRKSFWTRFWLLFPNVVLVVATSPLWLPLLSALLKLPTRAYLFVLGHFLVNALWTHIQQALQGAKLMRRQATFLMLERLLIFFIVGALALSGRGSFFEVAFAYIVGPLFAGCLGLWSIRKLIFPIVGFDRQLTKRMLAFSLPILPTSLVSYMSTNYTDAFFITHYLSGAALGVYAVAYQIAGIAMQLPLLAGTVLMPLFVTLQVDGKDDRTIRFLHNVLPLLTLAWGGVCAVVAAFGSYVLPTVFGPQFQGIGELLWPLLAASVLAGPALMGYAPVATAKSATYVYMISSAAAAIVNLALNFILIPRYGLLGCAWATTFAYAINVIVLVSFVDRKLLAIRSWSLWTTVPAVLGAGYASWYGRHFTALLITLTTTALLAIIYRGSLAEGWAVITNPRRGATENNVSFSV